MARLYLACALTPYRGSTYVDNRGREHLAVEAAIREGLKIGTKHHYLDGIPLLYTAADLFKRLKLDDERFQAPSERVAIGLLLRNTAVHNPLIDSHWTVSLLFALVQDLVPFYDVENDTFDVESAKGTIETYNAFVTRIAELGLDKAVDARPILDGREVVSLLGAAKPGQWTGKILNRVVEWQLDHPEGTKDDCAEWLQAEKVAGKLVLEDSRPASGGKRGKNADKPEGAKKSKR